MQDTEISVCSGKVSGFATGKWCSGNISPFGKYLLPAGFRLTGYPLGAGPEAFYFLRPEPEDLLQLLFHPHSMQQSAQEGARQFIIYDIRHPYATGHRFEVVLVVPEAVGAHPLLVYKIAVIFYLRDLRHPENRYARKGPDTVSDELPGVDGRTEQFIGKLQVQAAGGKVGQVRWI